MFTTCTSCSTQFRVTPAQLRAAHGLVRCGRCQTVFDAFETLTEETAAQPPPATAPASEASAADREPHQAAAQDEEPAELSAADISLEVDEPETPLVEDLFAELERSGSLTAAQVEPPLSLPEEPSHEPDTLPELPPGIAERAPRPGWHRLPWAVGALLLVLLLGAQLIHINRAALARNPVIGPSLRALYAALGHPLNPPEAPGQWLVSGVNVTSDPGAPGALSITGTLENRAAFAQPWPLLRVELTDRYGDVLRARDFPARDYLPPGTSAAWLSPGMASRFRLDVVDPGPEAVGFAVQTCAAHAVPRACLPQPDRD